MLIDFTPVNNKEKKLVELVSELNLDDLRAANEASIDALVALLADMTDEDVVFEPVDEAAKDDAAVEGEEDIAWSFAHLIAHVTSSSEEGVAFSSLLARGISAEERPRYETPWQEITTRAHCLQRLEESRRMRAGYLNTWPDTPHLDVYRTMSPRFEAYLGGRLNAVGAVLLGLWHEVGHYAQLQEVRDQALAAR